MSLTVNSYPNIEDLELDLINFDFENIELNLIIDIINIKFEEQTKCKLYNKEFIINNITLNKTKTNILQNIIKNTIPQITFNELFKSNLEFNILFNEDNINIYYKNIKINDENVEEIKDNLINTKREYLPESYNLYLGNIFSVINKFINKDIRLRYNCIDIPLSYLKLFEIKCFKNKVIDPNDKYKICNYYDKYYGKILYLDTTDPYIQCDEDDEEGKEEMKEEEMKETDLINNGLKELDELYSIEVISFLDDNTVSLFLNSVEQMDIQFKDLLYNDMTFITKYIKFLNSKMAIFNNTIVKFYFVNKLFRFIQLINIPMDNIFYNNNYYKMIEIQNELNIMISSELKIIEDVKLTIINCKKYIETILNIIL